RAPRPGAARPHRAADGLTRRRELAEGVVSAGQTLPEAADPRRAMPGPAGARRDAIDAAIRTLDDESRRFARMGFVRPLERCREARRFWSFVAALHALGP